MSDELLRPDLLAGTTIAVAGTPGGEFGDAVIGYCGRLGASVRSVDVGDLGEEALATAVATMVSDLGAIDALVNDGASLFAMEENRPGALRSCLDRCWVATNAVANGAFIARECGGRIVNVAPRRDAGAHAAAARAGLENLARTLSVEWARHGIVTTTIVPGAATDTNTVAQLVAFLLSPAGGYYSGCLFTLDGVSQG